MAVKQKKRTKKYTPLKTKRVNSAVTLKQFKQALFFCVGHAKEVKLLSLNDYALRDPTQLIYEAIAGVEHFWYYTLFVLCRTQTGEEYVICYYPDFIDIKTKKIVTGKLALSHTDAAALMEQPHRDTMKKGVNPMHVVTTGWITCPYAKEVEPQEVSDIADKYDLWRYSTKWEHENGEK